MSRENVEIVRANFEAFNAGDLVALREMYDPDVIVRVSEDWPEPGPFVGREAVMRQGEQLRETWDAVTLEPIGDFMDVGDRVAVRHVWRGVGHGPPDTNLEFTVVYTIRSGKILGFDYFRDHAEALEAMGLSGKAMPRDNVEIVQGMYEAWNRSGGTPQLELMDTEIEVDAPGLGGGVYRGHAGLSEVLESFWGYFEDHRIEVEECIPAGDDVVATVHYYGRGKTSGVQVDMRHWHVWTLRDRKVVRWRVLDNRGDALEAAGLSEQDVHH